MKEYRCPQYIKDLFQVDREKAYARSLDYIERAVLPHLVLGDKVETPDGKWLVKDPKGSLQ